MFPKRQELEDVALVYNAAAGSAPRGSGVWRRSRDGYVTCGFLKATSSLGLYVQDNHRAQASRSIVWSQRHSYNEEGKLKGEIRWLKKSRTP